MKKQKIVIKVQLCCDKQKARALEIASVSQGVTSIAITGDDKDQVEVTGEGMDPVKLTNSIRKKVNRSANLVRVEEVKPKDDKEPKKEQDSAQGIYCYPYQYYPQPALYSYEPDYNPNPCSIM
ncbi:hypothetical protein Vadar_017396 [Vaccinium darrowii]|uniref:Uncharacterized protein n=1 Tax=Vaccinium darrowii TaxID=229202 RepID=A0ACB7Z4W8_9ERIC|nr:hypothetical protein Vadar_017396 [Vaccinium darrowii]